MDFRPSSDRDAFFEEEGSTGLSPSRDTQHDFDAPAWRRPARGRADPPAWRRRAPRLINLERRARFASLPLAPR